jgi:hypothetical protein
MTCGHGKGRRAHGSNLLSKVPGGCERETGILANIAGQMAGDNSVHSQLHGPGAFAGVLLDYLARILVVSQTSKLCMAKMIDLRFILHLSSHLTAIAMISARVNKYESVV